MRTGPLWQGFLFRNSPSVRESAIVLSTMRRKKPNVSQLANVSLNRPNVVNHSGSSKLGEYKGSVSSCFPVLGASAVSPDSP